MHSNSPLHLYSVYLLYIYTYRRYTSIYTYIYGTSVRCQKHFDLRRLSPNYSLCIFNSAFSVHLSVSPPLATPCNSTQMCVRMCVIGCGASLFQVLLRCYAMWLHICGSFRALFELGNSLFGFSSLLVVCSCVCPRVVCVAL